MSNATELKSIVAELAKLREQNDALRLALSTTKRARKYSVYLRTADCKNANSYHKSVAQFLDKDFEKILTDADIVSRDDDGTIVVTDDFDAEFVAFIKSAVEKFRR